MLIQLNFGYARIPIPADGASIGKDSFELQPLLTRLMAIASANVGELTLLGWTLCRFDDRHSILLATGAGAVSLI
jgi:hypothetical protein